MIHTISEYENGERWTSAGSPNAPLGTGKLFSALNTMGLCLAMKGHPGG